MYPFRNFVVESVDPSADCSQQNLLNFRSAECSPAEYFVEENLISQNVDYLQCNFLNSRMFIGRIFSQQNPRNAECSLAKYFVAKSQNCRMQNVHRQNILQQNPINSKCSLVEYFIAKSQKCRMFIGRIFCSRKFQKSKCRSFGRLFTAKSAKFQKCRMLICRIFRCKKFQKPKCRYLSRLFTAEYSTAEFCIEFQRVFLQNILPQNLVLNS